MIIPQMCCKSDITEKLMCQHQRAPKRKNKKAISVQHYTRFFVALLKHTFDPQQKAIIFKQNQRAKDTSPDSGPNPKFSGNFLHDFHFADDKAIPIRSVKQLQPHIDQSLKTGMKASWTEN